MPRRSPAQLEELEWRDWHEYLEAAAMRRRKKHRRQMDALLQLTAGREWLAPFLNEHLPQEEEPTVNAMIKFWAALGAESVRRQDAELLRLLHEFAGVPLPGSGGGSKPPPAGPPPP